MKKIDKKQVIIIIVLLLLAVILCWFFINKTSSKQNEPTSEKKEDNLPLEYTIIYDDEVIDGYLHKILVYDGKIEIINYCDTQKCTIDTETTSYNCSENILNKFTSYIRENYSGNEIVIKKSSLKEKDINIISNLMIGEYWLDIALEDYKYLIEYAESDNHTFFIFFKEDGSILVKRATIKENFNISKINTYTLNFSKEKLELLNNYVKNISEYKKTNYITRNSTLTKNEINIYRSIVEDNEKYLDEDDIKLLYTVYYNGLNCPTPTLYLYDDNTYDYYFTFAENNEKVIPEEGVYRYDFNKVINKLNKYKKDEDAGYVIMDSNHKIYYTSSNNVELNDFLNSIGVVLKKCSKQQK